MIERNHIVRGAKVSCIIQRRPCSEAKIQISGNHVFLCQNVADGDRCEDKLGYEFSWSIGPLHGLSHEDTDSFFRRTEVTKVKLIELPEWDEEKNHVYDESPF